ncbi:hemolysin type calcium-binding protein [Palleronia aestuarii]|uniref:Hemolysin type calcium-binding protein n=1 Tax=Palleronia aestuarii TaxID=568105 RepID=A0A2W7NCX4_9RHOB|nr:calcium-binding protein [Palleronia aestuarii]PZX18225.1 hemolysin type calcium-binding protein [Palleronia aestuarii]
MAISTDAIAGRVTRFDIGSEREIDSARIVDGPDSGYLSVDPGKETLAYVSTDPTATGRVNARVELTFADGETEVVEHVLDLKTGPERSGWGGGNGIYMLETDSNDESIVETGENHRKVYVSESDAALSRADIEAIEGKITGDYGEWLRDHPEYGGSEGRALDTDSAMKLWNTITTQSEEPTSHWLLFEQGYEYEPGRIIGRGVSGEDGLHPVHVTSWGNGDLPELQSMFEILQARSDFVVVSDVAFTDGIRVLSGDNLIMEDVKFSQDFFTMQGSDHITIRQSEFIDNFRDAPVNPGGWDALNDRVQGVYASDVEGLLLEQNFFDHSGWEAGYDPDGDPSDPHPPSKFSHNMYIQYSTTDVTLRDTVSMRAASFGAQLRGGALAEDNLFLDNNAALNFGGGYAVGDQKSGNYTLLNGNVVTSGAHKDADRIGAMTLGIDDYARMSALVSNLVTHVANPDDPAEIERKVWETAAVTENGSRVFDDTIVHNWDTPRYPRGTVQERNTDGLDPAAMNEATIQNYAAELLGKSDATIDDLADYWRGLTARGGEVDIQDVLDFFRDAFEIETSSRSQATTLTFVPNELGEGTRWDNRLNWDTDDLPGSVEGDSVDLNGSFVQYLGTTRVDGLDFGPGGILAANAGSLYAESVSGEGNLQIHRAGQIWFGGFEDGASIDVTISGGRFVNDGGMNGAIDILATGGEVVLATGGSLMDLTDGTLRIDGDTAKVGFDGKSGSAGFGLSEGGTLEFVARAGEFAQIAEFRTGAFPSGDVVSLVNLDGGDLAINAGGIDGNGSFDLIEVDALIGTLEDVRIAGLGSRDAEIVLDHEADILSLRLSGGSGQTSITVVSESDQEASSAARQWDALVSGVDLPEAETPDDTVDVPEAELPEDEGAGEPDAPEPEEPEEPETPVEPAPEEPEEPVEPAPEEPEEPETPVEPAPEEPEEPVEPEPEEPTDTGGDTETPSDEADDTPDAGEEPSETDEDTVEAPAFVLSDGAEGDNAVIQIADPSGRFDLADMNVVIGTDGGDDLRGETGIGNLIRTGGGDDKIVGQDGMDWIEAGEGKDTIYGGTADDVLYGGGSDDEIYGQNDNDTVIGGDGSDQLYGELGDDVVIGGAGRDFVDGGDGDDTVLGGSGNDMVQGRAGDDILLGGSGNDELVGGRGADQFVFDVPSVSDQDWFDVVWDFQGGQGDTIVAMGPDAVDFTVDVTSRMATLSVESGGEDIEVAYIFGSDLDALKTVTEAGEYTIFG